MSRYNRIQSCPLSHRPCTKPLRNELQLQPAVYCAMDTTCTTLALCTLATCQSHERQSAAARRCPSIIRTNSTVNRNHRIRSKHSDCRVVTQSTIRRQETKPLHYLRYTPTSCQVWVGTHGRYKTKGRERGARYRLYRRTRTVPRLHQRVYAIGIAAKRKVNPVKK